MTGAGRGASGGVAILRHRAGLFALLSGLLLMVGLAVGAGPVTAQTLVQPAPVEQPQAAPSVKPTVKPSVTPSVVTGQKTDANISITKGGAALDYAEWERAAARAEEALGRPDVSAETMEALRSQLADWRAAFLASQKTNETRIATLREQIAALGPVPAEGETEASEITKRRQALSDQLTRLQAPGIAAEEAYRRADGLIGEIDRTLRERQADRLLQLWPAPINPANWPAALVAIKDIAVRLWSETAARWRTDDGRRLLFDSLPLVLVLTALGLGLLWRGRPLMARLATMMHAPQTARGRRVVALILSLGQVIVPTLGVLAITEAVTLTGMLGPLGMATVSVLPILGFSIFTATWLGGCVFPVEERGDAPFRLPPERRAEGRFLTATIGLLLAVETLRQVLMVQAGSPEAASSVLGFPVVVAVAVLIFRIGQVLRVHVRARSSTEDGPGFDDRVLGLLARGAMAVGVIGPLLAAIGYFSAAGALVYPAAISLGLVALLFVLQRLIGDLYGLITKSDAADQEGLVPVLIAFAMTLATLPIFALIWGARMADITELWQRFLGGFQLGQTRVSPTDFLIFLIVFGAGYSLTRLFQGALRGTILPRTSLDPGGQTAVVSGVGYVGIFLAALAAINSAGIDLSGLAIVAGALSVGIGFGLQNIVSNFVSGIILLTERPVSEGDWIEVGGVQGTVKAISVRSTRIQTFDRTDVIVPNSDLVQGRVTNWTRFNLSGRLIVPVAVAFGTDTRKVDRILREIAESQPLAVLNPPPVVALMGFGIDTINFEIRLILRDVNFSLQVRSDMNHAIVARFAADGIEIGKAIRTQPAGTLVPAALAPPPPLPEASPRPRPRPRGPRREVPEI